MPFKLDKKSFPIYNIDIIDNIFKSNNMLHGKHGEEI
jgi:hypothetical protein